MKNDKWDARIHRAAELASTHAFASEGLRFYGHIAQSQKSLYSEIQAAGGAEKEPRPPGSLRQELDLFLLLPRFSPFLAVVENHAPAALSQSAAGMRAQGATVWQESLTEFWNAIPNAPADLSPAEALLSWIFLQPYAQYLADQTQYLFPNGTPSVCPLCSAKPQVGVLRPEGDGAKRSLICSLCATEWDYRRLVCPSCGEEDVHKLAVYSAKEFQYVRVEACDTCRCFLNTVDLTKNGNAIPVVDELATIPLSLWATEQGYAKIQPNLLGI
jgi:FdhE protein